ncbi:MAG: hypothetical protein GY855_07630 [candidate division Zixibacteria bacterium]|nr:hypothetical protein [candidate division Zixibacteria bacterium]
MKEPDMGATEVRNSIEKIASDKKSGAFLLSNKLIRLFSTKIGRLSSDEIKKLIDHAQRRIADSHAAMPSINRVLDTIKSIYELNPDNELFIKELRILKGNFSTIPDLVSQKAYPLLRKYSDFITLSNSGLVARFFKKLHTEGSQFRLFICESLPGRESYLLARYLHRMGIKVTIIPDSAVADIINHKFSIVTGCDIISPTHIRNKIGSHQLGIMAKSFKAKFVVLGDSYKFVKDISTIPIPADEPATDSGGIKKYYKIFEDYPVDLVNLIVTEDKVIDNMEISSLFY